MIPPNAENPLPGLSQISIIVPALNESDRIGRLVDRLNREPGIEVIVVDGGSRDGTPQLAENMGARVIESPKGRAVQMNAGAGIARGEILFFLHADTFPPEGFPLWIRKALGQTGVVAGAFRVEYDTDSPMLRLIRWTANVRSRWFQLPYGDQGLFLTTERFREVGGFPDYPVMEDLALVTRLRRLGKIVTLPVPVQTSARSWRTLGTGRVTFFHVTGLMAYWLGVSPRKIHKWFLKGGYDKTTEIAAASKTNE